MRTFVVCSLLAAAGVANANPRALPFTYTTDTLPAGGVEIEQYVDLVSLRAISAATTKPETYLASAFQTEIEIGLTDRLELGLYVTWVPDFGESYAKQTQFAGSGSGLKQRLRYRFADPGKWPIDVGVYGELVENEREIELEAKVLLTKRFGRVRVAANVSGEFEWYFSKQREWVLNPSLGATYEVTPRFHLGLETWLRGEYPTNPKPVSRTFGLGPQAYAGPALMYNFGKIWWAVGLYTRVTDISHVVQPGEPYGRFWMRSMIGYDL